MKKLICAAALLLLLTFAVHASAVDFSSMDLFSSMSVYDLIRARNILSEELMKHGYTEHALIEGKYTVGEEIPAGVYKLSTPELFGPVSFFVYSADGDRIDIRNLNYDWRNHECVESNDSLQIELLEGQVLDLRGPITFYEY